MEHQNQIIVKGLPEEVDEKDVRIRFEKFGDIKDIRMKSGFCFIDFDTDFSAKEAIEKMNNELFNSSKITVEVAENRRNNHGGRFSRDKDFNSGGMGGNNYDRPRRQPNTNDVCHNCQGIGHWASDCKEEKRPR